MTNTQFISAANLPNLTFDQLAAAWAFCAGSVLAAETGTARTRAMNSRERVGNEVSRRGAVIRRLADGTYSCDYLASFDAVA